MKHWKLIVAYAVISAATILFISFAVLVSAHYEMQSFNNCTGGNATLVDAVFTELRVIECNQ